MAFSHPRARERPLWKRYTGKWRSSGNEVDWRDQPYLPFSPGTMSFFKSQETTGGKMGAAIFLLKIDEKTSSKATHPSSLSRRSIFFLGVPFSECPIQDEANMPGPDMTENVWLDVPQSPLGPISMQWVGSYGGRGHVLYFNINSLPTSLRCWEKGSDSPQARSLLLRLPIKCPRQLSRHTLMCGSKDFIFTQSAV